MPLNANKGKILEPLSSDDIRRVFFNKGIKIAAWARGVAKKHKTTIWPSDVWAVISRKPGYVNQLIKQELADFCDCDVSQIGNEPRRKPSNEVESVAA
jgi:hypothetical protein